MSNGNCEIQVGGVKHSLYFGRQAVEEFARRMEKYLSDNGFKIAVDMVYAGITNYNTKNDIPVPTFPEVYDLVEKLADEKDYNEQYETVAKCFWESKYGSDYSRKIEELKKKVEQEIQEMTAEQPTSTGPSSENTA